MIICEDIYQPFNLHKVIMFSCLIHLLCLTKWKKGNGFSSVSGLHRIMFVFLIAFSLYSFPGESWWTDSAGLGLGLESGESWGTDSEII